MTKIKTLVIGLMLLLWVWLSYAKDLYVKPYALNVRNVASMNSIVVDVVYQWEALRVISENNNWWVEVQTPNVKVWYVRWELLTEEWEWTYTLKQDMVSNNVDSVLYEVNVYRANFRSVDDIDSIVAVLHKGDKITTTDSKMLWWNWIKAKVIESEVETNVWKEWYIYKWIVTALNESWLDYDFDNNNIEWEWDVEEYDWGEEESYDYDTVYESDDNNEEDMYWEYFEDESDSDETYEWESMYWDDWEEEDTYEDNNEEDDIEEDDIEEELDLNALFWELLWD